MLIYTEGKGKSRCFCPYMSNHPPPALHNGKRQGTDSCPLNPPSTHSTHSTQNDGFSDQFPSPRQPFARATRRCVRSHVERSSGRLREPCNGVGVQRGIGARPS